MLTQSQYQILLDNIPTDELSFFLPAMIIESRSDPTAKVEDAREHSYGLWQVNRDVWPIVSTMDINDLKDQVMIARQIAKAIIADNPSKATQNDAVLYRLWRGWASETAENEFNYVASLWNSDYSYDSYVRVYNSTVGMTNGNFAKKGSQLSNPKLAHMEENMSNENSGVKLRGSTSSASAPDSPVTREKGAKALFGKAKDTLIGWYNQIKDKLSDAYKNHKPAFIIVSVLVAVIILFKIDNPLTRKLLSLADEYLEEGVRADGILGSFWRLLARILKLLSNKRVFAECAPKTRAALETYSRGIQSFIGGGGFPPGFADF
jgi:hypothetical protein